MHFVLDHRYAGFRLDEVSQNGLLGGRRHIDGLARNAWRRIKAMGNERPLLCEEFCAAVEHKREAANLDPAVAGILKRRRYLLKRSPYTDDAYGKSRDSWTDIFKRLNAKVPRVGNYVVPSTDPILESIQRMVPQMKVNHAEVCRTPTDRSFPERVTHRKTIIIHRETGDIEEIGDIQHWASLPKYKQSQTGKLTKVALTVFGFLNPSDLEGVSSVRSPQAETPDEKIAWGPPPMANHGPGYLNLNSEERSEIRQLHHNLGHPDPQRFAQYLRQGGAGVEVQKGALDFQCDACSESRTGYLAARPSPFMRISHSTPK